MNGFIYRPKELGTFYVLGDNRVKVNGIIFD